MEFSHELRTPVGLARPPELPGLHRPRGRTQTRSWGALWGDGVGWMPGTRGKRGPISLVGDALTETGSARKNVDLFLVPEQAGGILGDTLTTFVSEPSWTISKKEHMLAYKRTA